MMMSPEVPHTREILYTEREAAALLKMTKRMLATRRLAGKIRYVVDGKYLCYTQAQIEE